MATAVEWQGAELAGLLTTYIAGIEDVLKPILLRSVACLNMQVDAPFETLQPIVIRAYEHVDVNLPGED
jgi:hypothetical protein